MGHAYRFEINSTGSNFNESEYIHFYENLCHYVLMWYLPLLIIMGILGNVSCLLFLTLSKLFPKSILIWLISICAGDMMIALWDTVRLMAKVYDLPDIRDSSESMCRIHTFFSNYFFYWSAYMQTCMSLQRLFFIVQPFLARRLLSFKRIIIIWITVTVIIALPHIPYLTVWSINPKTKNCEPISNWYYYVTSITDLVAWGIIPLLTMSISTIIITVEVVKIRKRMPQVINTADNTVPSYSESHSLKDGKQRFSAGKLLGRSSRQQTLLATNDSHSLSNRSEHKHGKPGSSSGHVTKLLILINFFYILTTFPLLTYFMVLNFSLGNQISQTIPKTLHKFFYYLFRSLCYLNIGFNWIFYCVSGRYFRLRLKRMLEFVCLKFSMCTGKYDNVLFVPTYSQYINMEKVVSTDKEVTNFTANNSQDLQKATFRLMTATPRSGGGLSKSAIT